MTSYTPMQRFLDSLTGRPHDHVPVIPSLALWAVANFGGPDKEAMMHRPEPVIEAQIKAVEAAGYDALFAYPDPLYIPQAFGCEARLLPTGPVVKTLDLPLSSVEDVDRLPLPDPEETGRLPQIHKIAEGLRDYCHGERPILGLFEGPLTTATRLFKADRILRLPYKNPAVLEALLDRITDFLVGFAQALTRHGVNTLFIPDPSSSCTMISPKMFERFELPRLGRIMNAVDVPKILHICGDTGLILELMARTGASVLSLDQCMDLADARRRLPDSVIGGAVDPVTALLLGGPKEVEADTLRCLKAVGVSRYVLMSGCSVGPGTSLENLKAMVQTAQNYGLGDSTVD